MSKILDKDLSFLRNSEMGLGTWSWGDRIFWNYGRGYTDDDIAAAFETSLSGGIHLVDTAEVYGSGRSEILLGQFLKASKKPVFVATKFMPFPWRLNRSALMQSLDRSLERLGLEQVNLYQIHWPFPPMPVEFWVEELSKAVKSGKALTVGVSNYNKSQMLKAHDILSKYNIPLASNQVEYHLLNRTVERNGLLDRCNELGIRLIAYSPLAKGLLTGKYTPKSPPPGSRGRTAGRILKEIKPLIGLLTEIGTGHGNKTSGQVALNWIICKGGLPIPGAKTSIQAEQNIGAKGWRLTGDEIQALDNASDIFTK
jgi:aryl-alcohol dehydrogenase-like predicted oxidoreductase